MRAKVATALTIGSNHGYAPSSTGHTSGSRLENWWRRVLPGYALAILDFSAAPAAAVAVETARPPVSLSPAESSAIDMIGLIFVPEESSICHESRCDSLFCSQSGTDLNHTWYQP